MSSRDLLKEEIGSDFCDSNVTMYKAIDVTARNSSIAHQRSSKLRRKEVVVTYGKEKELQVNKQEITKDRIDRVLYRHFKHEHACRRQEQNTIFTDLKSNELRYLAQKRIRL